MMLRSSTAGEETDKEIVDEYLDFLVLSRDAKGDRFPYLMKQHRCGPFLGHRIRCRLTRLHRHLPANDCELALM